MFCWKTDDTKKTKRIFIEYSTSAICLLATVACSIFQQEKISSVALTVQHRCHTAKGQEMKRVNVITKRQASVKLLSQDIGTNPQMFTTTVIRSWHTPPGSCKIWKYPYVMKTKLEPYSLDSRDVTKQLFLDTTQLNSCHLLNFHSCCEGLYFQSCRSDAESSILCNVALATLAWRQTFFLPPHPHTINIGCAT